MLASPFVGVSNDALVAAAAGGDAAAALHRAREGAARRALAERDRRLLQAFRQRYDRLAAVAGTVGLERLCEQIVVEHDYDLAVLAQWDGRRRYANLRKLARLARSYEELRGPDVEGFVRFVCEQDAAGVKELEAVAEEEGADAVRLLTIHAAKGLEFKVVVVADAGRDRPPTSGEEIICLPDGRFGFKVVDPLTGRRRGAFDYDEVRDAEEAAEEAERLRLYYVAMTRAIDRLIVAGSIDSREARRPRRRSAGCSTGSSSASSRTARSCAARRGSALRVDRYAPEAAGRPRRRRRRRASSRCSTAAPTAPAPAVPALPPLEPVAVPPVEPVRRLSYTALALFERCSYRFYAERLAGHAAGRRLRRGRSAGRATGLAATEIGDAVHRLLERIDLARARPPSLDQVLALVSERRRAEELERIGGLVEAYCASTLAARLAALDGVSSERPFAFEHDGVLFHGVLDVLHLDGGRALVVDYKTNLLGEHVAGRVVEAEYRLQRLVYALACFRAGAEEVEVVYQFLERPDDARRGDVRARRSCRSSRPSSRRRSRGSRPGSSRRRRASSPAPAARRSTSSAPGRGCTEPGDRSLLGQSLGSAAWHGASSRRRAAASGRSARGSARSSSGCAVEHADARIALRFRSDLELLVSVMLSAQTTDVNVNRVTDDAVREVPAARGLPRRPAGGARARHLRDRLLPAEGEGDPRHDARCCSRSTTGRCRAARGARAAARASRARRRTSSPPSSASRRASSSTRTSAGSRSGSA